MDIEKGEIILAWIPDPDNNPCDHPHPALVFRSNRDSNVMWVIGITGSFREPLPWYWMKLPYADEGHPITGLSKPSVLKANWVVACRLADVVTRLGKITSVQEFERAVDLVLAVVAKNRQGDSL